MEYSIVIDRIQICRYKGFLFWNMHILQSEGFNVDELVTNNNL